MQEPRSELQTKVIRQAVLNSRVSKGFIGRAPSGKSAEAPGLAPLRPSGWVVSWLPEEIPSSGWPGGAKPWESGDTVIGVSGVFQSDLDACQQEKIDFPWTGQTRLSSGHWLLKRGSFWSSKGWIYCKAVPSLLHKGKHPRLYGTSVYGARAAAQLCSPQAAPDSPGIKSPLSHLGLSPPFISG